MSPRACVLGASLVLDHVPDLVRHGYKPRREGHRVDELTSALRSFEDAVRYPPNQVMVGALPPESLWKLPRPWWRDPAPAEAESPPLPPLELLPRLPAGAPRVQVSFLFYSPVAERRTVLLSVDGSSTETLHEGERAGDLEVARILPDRVHVRWSGQLFSVRARDY